MSHCFYRTSCCVHVIHDKYTESVHSLSNLKGLSQILLSFSSTQFFLRPGILCLSYDLIRYRNLQISSDPVCTLSAMSAAWLNPLSRCFRGYIGTGMITSGFHARMSLSIYLHIEAA